MPVCSVITCIYSQDYSGPPAEGIVFHRFPTNPEVRAKWVDMTGLDDWSPTFEDYICSRHFRDTDFIVKRSGKRYLKTAAIPCEYVVYRHLFPDEEVVDVKLEATADEDDVDPPAHLEEGPKVVVIHEPEPEYDIQEMGQPGPSSHNMEQPAPVQPEPNCYEMQVVDPDQPGPSRYGMQDTASKDSRAGRYGMQDASSEESRSGRHDVPVMDPIPGPSRGFPFAFQRNHSQGQVPDSTMATIYDSQNVPDWDQFRPERYFAPRLPNSIFEDSSQEVDSSGIDEPTNEPYGRDEEAPRRLFPTAELDLQPHLQHLPPPRTPEPVVPQLDEAERLLDPERGPDYLDIPVPSPIKELMEGQQKLQDIKKIMSRRKSSRKAVAAAVEEVIEAKKAQLEMQSRKMSEREVADAIIALQTKRIIKLDMKHRKLRKILKRISAVLRRVE